MYLRGNSIGTDDGWQTTDDDDDDDDGRHTLNLSLWCPIVLQNLLLESVRHNSLLWRTIPYTPLISTWTRHKHKWWTRYNVLSENPSPTNHIEVMQEHFVVQLVLHHFPNSINRDRTRRQSQFTTPGAAHRSPKDVRKSVWASIDCLGLIWAFVWVNPLLRYLCPNYQHLPRPRRKEAGMKIVIQLAWIGGWSQLKQGTRLLLVMWGQISAHDRRDVNQTRVNLPAQISTACPSNGQLLYISGEICG